MRRIFRYTIRTFYLGVASTVSAVLIAHAREDNNYFLLSFGVFLGFVGLLRICENYLLEFGSSRSGAKKPHRTTRVAIFVNDENIESVRISLLSVKKIKGATNPIVIFPEERDDVQTLCSEFGFDSAPSLDPRLIESESILVTNGHSVIYPDAITVARRRLDESLDVVELNHSQSNAQSAFTGSTNSKESLSTQLARSLGSHGIFYYSGGPIVVRNEFLSETINSTESVASFDEFVAVISSEVPRGAMTAHPCCECMSHNEIDHNVEARTSRFRVLRSRERHQKIRGWRQRIAWRYSALAGFRTLATLVFALVVAGLIIITWEIDDIPVAVFPLLVLQATVGYVMHRSVGDRRAFITRCTDEILETESYLRSFGRPFNVKSRLSRWHVKFSPVFLCFVLGLTVVKFVSTRGDLNSSVVIGLLLSILLYMSTKDFLSARQRAFARRQVSIVGSSSYETMTIIDLTHRGAAYISDIALELGDETPLVFHIPDSTDDLPVTIVGRVTYCGPRGDKYQIGVEFLELTFKARDELMEYCSITYPFSVARGESTEISPPPLTIRKKIFTRDPLALAFRAAIAAILLGLLVAPIPTERSTYSVNSIDAVSAIGDQYISSRNTVEPRDGDVIQSATLTDQEGALSPIEKPSGPDLVVSTTIVNETDAGFSLNDVVRIRVSTSNVGNAPAKSGWNITTEIGQDVRKESLTLQVFDGFFPCGFSDLTLKCTSTVPLAPGEVRAVEFEVKSAVGSSTPSARRRVASRVLPVDGETPEIVGIDYPHSNNRDDAVIAAGSPAAIGDRVFFDANANGLLDSGEGGVQGVRVTLQRYDDINGDGFVDPGETKKVSNDVTDARGFFGASKGTAGFMNLASSKQYSLKFSSLPDGMVATKQNAPGAVAALGRNGSPRNDSDVVPGELVTPWTVLDKGEIDLSFDLGVVFEATDLELTLQRANKDPLTDQEVRLHRWIDENDNAQIDRGELQENYRRGTSSIKGALTLTGIREDVKATRFALEVSSPQGLAPPEGIISARTEPLTEYVSHFESVNDLATFSTITFDVRGATITGTVWSDFNRNNKVDSFEQPTPGVVVQLRQIRDEDIVAASSDSEGVIQFVDVSPGTYRLSVSESSLPYGMTISSWPFTETSDGTLESRETIKVLASQDIELQDISLESVLGTFNVGPEDAKSGSGIVAAVGDVLSGDAEDASITPQDFELTIRWLSALAGLAWLLFVVILLRRRKLFR